MGVFKLIDCQNFCKNINLNGLIDCEKFRDLSKLHLKYVTFMNIKNELYQFKDDGRLFEKFFRSNILPVL